MTTNQQCGKHMIETTHASSKTSVKTWEAGLRCKYSGFQTTRKTIDKNIVCQGYSNNKAKRKTEYKDNPENQNEKNKKQNKILNCRPGNDAGMRRLWQGRYGIMAGKRHFKEILPMLGLIPRDRLATRSRSELICCVLSWVVALIMCLDFDTVNLSASFINFSL